MNAFKKLSLTGALLAGVLTGCGGGTSTASISSALSGTAAVGAPIVTGTITIRCAGGNPTTPATTTTDTVGAWSLTLTGQTLPCAVQVSGGTINGVPNTTPYHSIASVVGTVNVTPVSDLIVANATGSTAPATWFATVTPTALAGISPATLTASLAQIRTALNLPALNNVNPLTTAFTPAAGNPVDDILTALQLAITNTGNSLAALQIAAASSTFTAPVGFSSAINTQHSKTSSGGAAVPTAPTALTAGSATTSAILLSWTAVSGATGYNVYRSTSANVATTAANKITVNPITASTYVNSALTASTAYFYKVTTLGASGESLGSNEATATTLANTIGGGTTPTASNYSPSAGAIGSAVVITGTNLTSVTDVLFTGPSPSFAFVAGTISAKMASSITATVPASLAAGAYTLTIVSPGNEVTLGTFTVTTAPTPSTAIGMTVAPAANGLTSFPNAVPTVTVTGSDRTLTYRKASTTDDGFDYFDIGHAVVSGETYLSIDLRVGNAITINGNPATSFVSHTLFCTLIPAPTPSGIALCSTKGIVFDKTAGSVTMTNTPLTRSVVVNGSFSFTPF